MSSRNVGESALSFSVPMSARGVSASCTNAKAFANAAVRRLSCCDFLALLISCCVLSVGCLCRRVPGALSRRRPGTGVVDGYVSWGGYQPGAYAHTPQVSITESPCAAVLGVNTPLSALAAILEWFCRPWQASGVITAASGGLSMLGYRPAHCAGRVSVWSHRSPLSRKRVHGIMIPWKIIVHKILRPAIISISIYYYGVFMSFNNLMI